MRIQHNIMAMSAYRNYTNNVASMKKNLEKLSSGYKINRAGDDAAGLAISEKMRAQITGLQTAQKNAKDGISLVQTAEGALTEVHDMLNRMVELATQSANGTYDNDTDRAQLQKEMDQLRSEINRIADSSNFNGIKLLDGSMDASSISGVKYENATTDDILGLMIDDAAGNQDQTTVDAGQTVLETESVKATKAGFEISLDGVNVTANDTDNIFTLTFGDKSMVVNLDEKSYSSSELAKALADQYKDGIVMKDADDNEATFTVKADGNTLKFTSEDKINLNASSTVTWELTDTAPDDADTYIEAEGYKEGTKTDATFDDLKNLNAGNDITNVMTKADVDAIKGTTYSLADTDVALSGLSLTEGDDDFDAAATAIQSALTAKISDINDAAKAAAGTGESGALQENDTYTNIDSVSVTWDAQNKKFNVTYQTTDKVYNSSGEWENSSDTDAVGKSNDGTAITGVGANEAISNDAVTALKGAGDGSDGKITIGADSDGNGGFEVDLAAALADIEDGATSAEVCNAIKTAIADAMDEANDDAMAADTKKEGFTGYDSSTLSVTLTDDKKGIQVSFKTVAMEPDDGDDELKTDVASAEIADIAGIDWSDKTDASTIGSNADTIKGLKFTITDKTANLEVDLKDLEIEDDDKVADVAAKMLAAANKAIDEWNTANAETAGYKYGNARIVTGADNGTIVAQAAGDGLKLLVDQQELTTPGASGSSGTINGGLQNVTSTNDGASAKLANTTVDFSSVQAWTDGAKITIGDTTYTVALGSDSKFKNAANVVDLTDMKAGDTTLKNVAAERLSNAANGNKIFTVGHNGSGKTTLQQKSAVKDSTDMTTKEKIASYLSVSVANTDSLKNAKPGNGLTLQIGDTADSYNQLKVDIKDMHTASLGLDNLSISDQDSAAIAIEKIKAAINSVSDVRGTLGATQNRLDHTINNLSVMTENIQDAESTIRDVDVAEEMMAYTKNNILIQSAQAMLAQANQVPQGVLQLLG